MTDDLLDQLRARNPAPGPMPAPPIAGVLARIAAGERPARPPAPRWPRWAGPSLAIAIVAVVAAIALVSLHATHHSPAPAGHTTRHKATPAPRPGPGEAMRGSLQSPMIGFGAGGTGVVAWTQLSSARTTHPKPWLASTGDGGRSWSVGRRSFSLSANPEFDGSRDGWTQGVDADHILRFYVTHDGGRSWAPAQSAAAADSVNGDVSVGDGVVWAVGTGSCSVGQCQWTVMRGPAAGDRLTATPSQPLPPTDQNATTITASSATTAYITAPAHHGTIIYATHDGGRHWQPIRDPCSAGSTDFRLTSTSTSALWLVCVRAKQFFAMRSTDGGARWSSRALPFVPLFAFEPVSSQVAWTQDIHGTIYRTADGGVSWQAVWQSGGLHGTPAPGINPILVAQTAGDASLLVQLTRGPTSHDHLPRSTNLMVYRTTDAGRTWQPSVIKLPSG